MNKEMFDKIHQINYLIAETDALYHQAAVRIGIADTALRVLYTIYDNGESCPLSEIYKRSGISKQTVNSAMRRLEADGIVCLEQYVGRAKMVNLTDKGKEYAKETAARLYKAEQDAFASWTTEEIDTHIRLLEKYTDSFRIQVQGL